MNKIILNLCNDINTYFQHDTYTIAHSCYKKWYRKGYYKTTNKYHRDCFGKYPAFRIPFGMGHIQPVCFDDLCIVNCICFHNYEDFSVNGSIVKVNPMIIECLNLCLVRVADLASKFSCPVLTYNSQNIYDITKNVLDKFNISYENKELRGVYST